MSKVTFGKPETWTSGWKGKKTKLDVRLDGKVVGAIVGKENAGIAGAMFWYVELEGKRPEECGSFKNARVRARALLEGGSA